MSINQDPAARGSARGSHVSVYSKLAEDAPETYANLVDESSIEVKASGESKEEAVAVPEKERTGYLGFSGELCHNVYVAFLFLTWWVLSIGYNIYNKRVLNNVDLAWSLAWIQFFVGVPINLIGWGFKLRPMPALSRDEIKSLLPVATCHCLTHVAGVISLGSGAVSFTHIIKAMEPIVTAVFTVMMFGLFYSWQVYACVVPIIGGVVYASLSGSIGWSNFGFFTAMMSNVFAALRAVIAKKIMKKGTFTEDQHMNSANIYAVMTFLSTALLLPVVLAVEAPSWASAWADKSEDATGGQIVLEAFASAFFYYSYNEVAFLCLANVTPVTHAVGNTAKRVLVIASAIVIFNTPMTTNGYVGSFIAIVGTLMYALSTKTYKTQYRFDCTCCVAQE